MLCPWQYSHSGAKQCTDFGNNQRMGLSNVLMMVMHVQWGQVIH